MIQADILENSKLIDDDKTISLLDDAIDDEKISMSININMSKQDMNSPLLDDHSPSTSLDEEYTTPSK